MNNDPVVEEERLGIRLNWLRAAVLGANDGIVSIAALVVGVAAAAPESPTAILLAGVAALVAGALSMGVGEYVSVSAQRDSEDAQLARERRWHDERPEWELEQLKQIHMSTGMSEQTASAAAIEQTAQDPLAIHALMHLGIDPDELVSPHNAAIASLLAFSAGGAVPLLTVILTTSSWQVPATFAIVVVMLVVTGFSSAALGRAPRTRAILRNVIGGSLAMGITFVVGHLLGVAV